MKKFTEEHKRKMSEAHKGKPGYWLGRKRSKETCKKMSKNHVSQSGEKSPNWKGDKAVCRQTYYCLESGCNNKVSGHNRRCKVCAKKIKYQKISERMKGKGNPNYGKPPLHIKSIKYKDIWMRSSWEVLYAQYLDENNIKWQYEPKTFDLGNITYTPDFYLPKFNKYIEIKGFWRGQTKHKFVLFNLLNPEIDIELLMRDELKVLGIKI